jgi:glutamate-1-semialdehyde 2,1-aminomutase
VPKRVAELTTVLPLDDTEALEKLMASTGDQIAAVIIEPIPANNGLLLQRREFLERLAELTAQHGALLIFDEVISGFRVAMGGAAELHDLVPDLVTFGKVVGGGMPVGAFAGRAELFARLAPDGPVYQAGTLSGNPVAMAAGLATLRILERDRVIENLEAMGVRFEKQVQDMLVRGGHPVRFVRQGSLFWFSFGNDSPPRCAEQIPESAAEIYARFHRACLGRGVYLAPSAYEVGFLCSAHTPEILEGMVGIFGEAFADAFAPGAVE